MGNQHYIGRHVNKDIVKKSSSGGIMTAVAEWIIGQEGIIFGAALADDCKKIEHIAVRTMDELNRLRKSKYVWSDFYDCLNDMELYLSKDMLVLFIGTPCQCSYIGKKFGKYSNLYLLDFFCHGTLESIYYEKYIESLRVDIAEVDFRTENDKDNFSLSVKKIDGTTIVSDKYEDNSFTNLFVSSAGIRKSCFSCTLCENVHLSNITMGDVEFEEMANNHYFSKKHLSFFSVNNEKGRKILDAICNNLEYAQLDERDSNNIKFYYKKHEDSCEPWGYNKKLRGWFENAYLEYGYEEAAYRCMFFNELQILNKYEKYLKKKEIYLYGAGKKGTVYKKLIEQYYPLCNLKGYIVSKKGENNFVNELHVYESAEIKLDDENIFIIVSVEKKKVIYEALQDKGLREGVNYG